MTPRRLRLLALSALALLPHLAHAQYSWIDDKGARVFSDRPPPPGTPPSRVLKAPRGLEPAPEPAAVPGGSAEKPSMPGWMEREADYRQRGIKRAKEEEQALTANRARAAACDAARAEQAQLNSGMRLVRIDKNGERDYVSDEERAQRLEKSKRALAQCP
jgi:hypothetical protein